MLDLAPQLTAVPRTSTVDQRASGLGRAFVDSIVAGDLDRLENLLAPDVRFRALTPRTFREATTAAGVRAIVVDWFGETDERTLVGSRVEGVGDRLAIGYRIELTEDGERSVVEQHVAATVDDGTFRDLALVCSGFRPLTVLDRGTIRTPEPVTSGDDRPVETLVFTPAARLDATGLSCATLTPTISATVRGLDFEAILEVVSDDPDAEEGLRSWTRLTGNELVAVEEGPGRARRYAIRRTPRRAATIEDGGTI